MSEHKPPLRARLHWYRLTTAELSLLTAMCEHCSDGSTIWAAIPRLAAYSKLSERHVTSLIRGLRERCVLSQLAPENTGKRRPAIYRLNEAALVDDPRMTPYRTRQQSLPGIHRVSAPGEPISDAALVKSVHQSPEASAGVLVKPVHQSGEAISPDSKAFDPKAIDPKPEIHHGDAALNSLPAWLAFKEQLRAEFSDEEWNLWVRPMLLLRANKVGPDQKHLIAAIPPNGRIESAAMKRLPMMREMLKPVGLTISLTHYPDKWEIEQARERYGIDMKPKPWTRKESA